MHHPSLDSFTHRVRRSSHQIVLAVALTMAALAFVVFAATKGTGSRTASATDAPAAAVKPN